MSLGPTGVLGIMTLHGRCEDCEATGYIQEKENEEQARRRDSDSPSGNDSISS